PTTRRRLPLAGGRRRHPSRSIGARTLGHQDDAAVPQHHRRGTAEGADRSLGTAKTAQSSQPVTTSRHLGPLRIVSHLSVKGEPRRRLTCDRLIFLGFLARPAGLEPATSWFVARRSIQLS